MRLSRTVPLVLAAVALGALASPARARQTPRDHSWFVVVSHRIDLDAYVSAINNRVPEVNVDLTNRVRRVSNLTAGIVVDTSGHVVTRLVNLDPAIPGQQISITTADGRSHSARFVGLDGPSGFAVLEVTGLRGAAAAPVQAPVTLRDSDLVNILSPDYRKVSAQSSNQSSQRNQAVTQGRRALFPTLPTIKGQVMGAAASPALARSGVLYRIQSSAFVSSHDLSVVEAPNGSVLGVAKYVAPGRGDVYPVSYIRDTVVARVVKANASVAAGWLGAEGISITDLPAAERPSGAVSGVRIDSLTPDGPASTAKLQVGDVVTRFDDLEIATTADLGLAVTATPAGSQARIGVLRNGKLQTLAVTLGVRPVRALTQGQNVANTAQVQMPQSVALTSPAEAAGLSLHEMSSQLAQTFGVEAGLLVDGVRTGAAAHAAGLQAGDIITHVDDIEVRDRAGFSTVLLNSTGDTVKLAVLRNRQRVLVSMAVRGRAATPETRTTP